MKLAIFFSFLFFISAVSAETFDYSFSNAFNEEYPALAEKAVSDFEHVLSIQIIHEMAVACNQKNMSFKYWPENSSCEPKVYRTNRPLSVFLQEPEPQCEIYSAGYAPRGVPTELEQVNADIVRNLTCAKLVSDYNDRMLLQAHAAMACLPPNTFVRYYNETETSCYPPQFQTKNI